jgi:hypothetical protein
MALEKPPLIEYGTKYITVYISREYHRGINGYGKEYESYNCKTLTVAFEPKWFEKIDWWYDGHWAKGYTICGITFYYTDFFTYELI